MTFNNVAKIFIFQTDAVLLNYLFICESWKIKCITVSIKILYSTTVFNIDNNQKCFLSSKSAYYYDFWRSCDTEDWSNDAENTALITEINYSLTYSIFTLKSIILNYNDISQFYCFLLYFLLNKCSLDEQKRLRSKTKRYSCCNSGWTIVTLEILVILIHYNACCFLIIWNWLNASADM